MRSANKNLFIILIAIFIAGGALIFAVKNGNVQPALQNVNAAKAVKIGNAVVFVELAQTSEEQAKGLSGRQTLGANSGMLFIFSSPGNYAFWMPEMNFPLDIIWMDGARRVIGVTENAPPLSDKTKPVLYRPPSPAQYVLEVNAGFARRHGIKVGDEALFKNIDY